MKKILIVEDDLLLSTILQKSFVSADFDARVANDGLVAEREIRSWHPDLVLLDLLMPNVDGFEVLKDVRSEPEIADTHVIVLSNLGGQETIDRVKEFGVNEYIVKANTTPDAIVNRVRQMFPADQ